MVRAPPVRVFAFRAKIQLRLVRADALPRPARALPRGVVCPFPITVCLYACQLCPAEPLTPALRGALLQQASAHRQPRRSTVMWADLVDGDEAGAEALGLAPLLGGDDSRQSQTMEDARSRDAAALRAPPPRANAWGTPAPWGVATADAPAPDSVTPTRDDVSSGGKPASGARATPVSGAARLNAWGAAALAFKQAAAPAPARRSGHAAARRVALDSELDDSRDGINLALKGLLPKKNVWGFGGAGVKAVTGAVRFHPSPQLLPSARSLMSVPTGRLSAVQCLLLLRKALPRQPCAARRRTSARRATWTTKPTTLTRLRRTLSRRPTRHLP